MDRYAGERQALVETLHREGISDARVLAAIGAIRRDAFVPDALAERAYENVALPIGLGQTISQPYIVALMTQALGLTGGERVLEVGTGSGYQAAVLSALARQVVSVERMPKLLDSAAATLRALGCHNVELHPAGDVLGWPSGAPFDRIIVTAAGPAVPPELLGQLALGGVLVMPVGTLASQRLVVARRISAGIEQESIGDVRFVPLVGAGAWSDEAVARHAAERAIERADDSK